MKVIVKKEVVKLLDIGIIYPISYNHWVSLVQVVPKKSSITWCKIMMVDQFLLDRPWGGGCVLIIES